MITMTYQTLSELLIVSLCTISCIRVFFRVRSDALSILPYFTFPVAIANVFAWGINYEDIILLSVALVMALVNVRSVLRLTSNLIVDHFSTSFSILNFFNSIICIILLVIIIVFRPINPSNKAYNTVETRSYYYLDDNKKPAPVTNLLNSKDIRIYKYGELLSDKGDKIILFVPNLINNSQTYKTLFYKLSQDGYTVYTAEIYGKTNPLFENLNDSHLLRMSKCINWRKNNPLEYNNFLKKNSILLQNQYQILLDVVNPDKDNTVILCCDGDYSNQILAIKQQNPDLIDGTFDISTIPEYKTPSLGPIQETDPLNAYFMDLKRDPSLYTSKTIASKIENYINNLSLKN